MNYLAFLLLLLAVCSVSGFNLRGRGNTTLQQNPSLPVMPGMDKKETGSYERIIHGEDATRGQFPYMVGLVFVSRIPRPDRFCGGSLISQKWVLTAAHCTPGAASVRVFLGMRTLQSASIQYWISSIYISVNPGYQEGTCRSNIALVEIPSVQYNDVIGPVDLPEYIYPYPTYDGASATALGWGITSRNGRMASTLKYTNLHIISNEVCERTYPNRRIYSGQICSSGHMPGAVCHSDNGGPLVLTGTKLLIGIPACLNIRGCASGYPDIFTRVQLFLYWINETTGILV